MGDREFIARVIEEQRGSYRLLVDDTEYRAVVAGRLRHRASRDGFGLLSDDAETLSTLAGDIRDGERGPRYVALARNGRVMPVILLTKADLCADSRAAVTELTAAMPGVVVHAMSVWLNQGLEPLAEYLSPGKTSVLLGSSGVGKSTIVNHLLGADAQRVSPVRQRDDRGRHTTTHRPLLRMPSGAFLIDTPGLREIQL